MEERKITVSSCRVAGSRLLLQVQLANLLMNILGRMWMNLGRHEDANNDRISALLDLTSGYMENQKKIVLSKVPKVVLAIQMAQVDTLDSNSVY